MGTVAQTPKALYAALHKLPLLAVGLMKEAWKKLPQSWRVAALSGLCRVRAQKRMCAAAGGTLFVLGAFSSTSGIAQGARLYADKKQRNNERVIRVDVGKAMLQRADMERPQGVLSLEEARALKEPGTVILHANPPQFQLVLCALGKTFLKNKRLVAYWAWELETIPEIWKQALEYVDAVEVPSSFVQRALIPHTGKEVIVAPHPAEPFVQRKTAFLENGCLRCLCMFSMASAFERKNPLAALRAFALAFPQGNAQLTFKVSESAAAPKEFAAFSEACRKVPGVRIVTETMDQAALSALYLAHDVYLSLHRSEGYGLTIQEALQHGLHVVATGWSGNMDFMQGPLAHPVPCTLIPVSTDKGAFKGIKARWAEPDVHRCAEILHKLHQELAGGQARA